MSTSTLALALALALAAAAPAGAGVGAPQPRRVPAVPGAIGATLARAAPGDTLVLEPGVHHGPVVVTRPVVLRGAGPGVIVAGGDSGSVVTVAGSGVVIERLEVRGSGRDVMNVDAGVRVIRGGGVTLRALRIADVLYGIYVEHADSVRIEDCDLTGRVDPAASPELGPGAMEGDGSGNGLHLWSCTNARIAGNAVRRFQDAIYMSFTNRTRVEGNRLAGNGRYGLHTMYCQDSHLRSNVFTRNVAGCAIMFSNRLDVRDNDFVYNRGSRTYGVLLKDCSDGEFTGNRMIGNTIAVFMDNSNRNRFHGNLVENNGWGLFVFSSCAGNEFAGNDFVRNDYPVALDMRYTDNRFDDGTRGNYWDENPVYDLDGDGLGDVPYSPVGAFAFVSKQFPDLTVLAKSPAVAALGVAERVLPALRPSEAVDRHPLVTPVAIAASRPESEARRPRRAWGVAAAAFALLGGGIVALRQARPVP
ncbi:MAG TPA: nitrous oxide reductase family maturation protein NosD [Candidatus Eisenbacteria bacterium]